MAIDLIAHTVLDGRPAAYFAPTYKMLSEVWKETSNTLRPISTRVASQEHRIDTITGGLVDMWSLDSADAPRGRKYQRVVIDEAAIVPDLENAWQAVIRPMLADYQGDAWFFSTPKGRRYFWQLYERGRTGEQDWKSWRFTTRDNPYISPAEIDSMRREMPDRIYRQEVEAEFIDDGGGVFRNVRKCATATAQDKAIDGHAYVFGVDWGRSNDYTVITVIDTALQACVHMDRFSQIDYSLQRGRLTALAEKFNPAVIMAELNSMGGPIVEQLQRDGLPVRGFNTTMASKMGIIEGLALSLEREQIAILPDETLIGELEAYEQEQLASGIRYNAPSGMHDDTVMSLAMAWSVGRRMATTGTGGWG